MPSFYKVHSQKKRINMEKKDENMEKEEKREGEGREKRRGKGVCNCKVGIVKFLELNLLFLRLYLTK